MGNRLLLQPLTYQALLIVLHAIQLKKSQVATRLGNSCFTFMDLDWDSSIMSFYYNYCKLVFGMWIINQHRIDVNILAKAHEAFLEFACESIINTELTAFTLYSKVSMQ